MKDKLVPIEREGKRVLLTAQLAESYGTEERAITDNFNNNKNRYEEGKHYFLLSGDDLRAFKRENEIFGFAPNLNKLYLWTERGALLHAKSLNTDRAWEVYDRLVETYFRAKALVKNAAQDAIKNANTESRLNYSRVKVSDMWLKIADRVPIQDYKDICIHYATAALAGKEVLPLPSVQERTYTAQEVGTMLGVSAHKVGRTANLNHLKTPEYGKEVWDKAKSCEKQVPCWRYNDRGVARLRELISEN